MPLQERHLQVGDVKINQFGRDIVVNRVLNVDLLDKVCIFKRQNLTGVAILNERVEVEWINGTQFIDTTDNNDRGLMDLSSSGNDTGAGSSDKTTISKDGVGTQNDLVDTGHERKDSGVRDQNHSDTVSD